MRLAITFDVPASLDFFAIKRALSKVLEIKNQRFTFFFPAAVASLFPELVEEALARDHEIASLGYFGEDYSRIRVEVAIRTLEKSKELLSEFYPVKAFRPPSLRLRKEILPWVSRFYSIESSRSQELAPGLVRLKVNNPLRKVELGVYRFKLPLNFLEFKLLERLLKNASSIGISEVAEGVLK